MTNVITLPGLAPRIPKPVIQAFDDMADTARVIGLLIGHEQAALQSIMIIYADSGKPAANAAMERLRIHMESLP